MPARDEDHRLLADFRAAGSQAAFAQLVARHLDLVYSIARRRVGDAHLAEDVTQAVFLTLARKASSIGSDVVISGWLFNTARLVANNALRAQQRRQKHESSARDLAHAAAPLSAVGAHAGAGAGEWDVIAPHLESAMDHLGRGERDAVLLRFYQGMSFKEVAGAIGISEDAAAQRVSRGVAKLRAYFAARGVNTSADALTTGVAAHAVAAAPAALKSTVATSAAATGTAATTLSNEAVHAMAIANLKFAAAVAAAVIMAGAAGVASYNAIAAARARAQAARPAAAPASRIPPTTTAAPTSVATAAPPATRPITQRMRAMLDRKLPELNFTTIAVGDVVDFLRDVTGANIYVNWRGLEALGAPRTRPITLRLRDRSLADALDAVLAQLSDRVGYTVKDEIMIDQRTPESVARLVTVPDPPPANDVLARRLAEVRFDAIALSDGLDFLRDVGGVKIEPDWEGLRRAGVTRKTPVTLRVRDVPLASVLTLLTESVQTNPPTARLGYAVDPEGIIRIGVARPQTRPATASTRR